MLLPATSEEEDVKETLPRRAGKVARKQLVSNGSAAMRDKQPMSNCKVSSGSGSLEQMTSGIDGNTSNVDALASCRTEKQFFATTVKAPIENTLKVASARAPPGSPRPAVGPSKPAGPGKLQSKMSAYTYREYFPRPIVRYVTDAAEADELVDALNGYVHLHRIIRQYPYRDAYA